MSKPVDNIDFMHEGKSGRSWRIKTADKLDEFIELFHLRYTVYKDNRYLSDEDINSRETYQDLKKYLQALVREDAYEYRYEIDKYDRFDSYVENGFNPDKCLTKHLLALEEDTNGPLLLDGIKYSLAGYMRVLLDDHNSSSNPIGFTPDSSTDLSQLRKKANNKKRILHEAGRLVKRKGAHPSMINGLTKAMVNCTLYGEKYSPDAIMSVRPNLVKYYNGLCGKRVSDVFYNNELKEEHVLLHIDLSIAKRLLTFANNPLTRPFLRILYPNVRIEDSYYSIQKLSN